jgi:hypothetical protein
MKFGRGRVEVRVGKNPPFLFYYFLHRFCGARMRDKRNPALAHFIGIACEVGKGGWRRRCAETRSLIDRVLDLTVAGQITIAPLHGGIMR